MGSEFEGRRNEGGGGIQDDSRSTVEKRSEWREIKVERKLRLSGTQGGCSIITQQPVYSLPLCQGSNGHNCRPRQEGIRPGERT